MENLNPNHNVGSATYTQGAS